MKIIHYRANSEIFTIVDEGTLIKIVCTKNRDDEAVIDSLEKALVASEYILFEPYFDMLKKVYVYRAYYNKDTINI